MVPDSLESIKILFSKASEQERSDYLLVGLKLLRDEMRAQFEEIHTRINVLNTNCLDRRSICSKTIEDKIKEAVKPNADNLTKTHAYIVGMVTLLCSIFFAIGAGYVKWYDVALKAVP